MIFSLFQVGARRIFVIHLNDVPFGFFVPLFHISRTFSYLPSQFVYLSIAECCTGICGTLFPQIIAKFDFVCEKTFDSVAKDSN